MIRHEASVEKEGMEPQRAQSLSCAGKSSMLCHCEELNDEAILALTVRGLLRSARNDNLSPRD
jgi:hypothetical protein